MVLHLGERYAINLSVSLVDQELAHLSMKFEKHENETFTIHL